MNIELRRASEEDRARILAISSQIWDGADYVPDAFANWMADPAGEVVVAVFDNVVIAFAYRTWLFPGYAWLQGIRADPAFRGRGAGRVLTEHLIVQAEREGAKRIGLSTYIDNRASIHIIESYGFRRVATFAYVQSEGRVWVDGLALDRAVEPISVGETVAYIRSSEFLEVSNGRFPDGWTFYPFEDYAAPLIERTPCRRGIRHGRRLVSLLCALPGEDADDPAFVTFLDGRREDFGSLLCHAQRELGGLGVELMLPKSDDREVAAIPFVRELGFKAWTGFEADIFNYELTV
jgi:GNAT superfamily N-acetyltransferase